MTNPSADAQVEGAWVKVAVRDFGIGIAEKDLETIFQKFHTLPSGGGNGRTKGTGLGLTICRKIVEAHGGRIWAESSEGHGSTFCLLLALDNTAGKADQENQGTVQKPVP